MSEFRLRGDEGFYDLLGLMRAWAGMWERSGVSRREAFEVALDALDKLGLPSSHPLVSEPDLPGMWEEADLSGGATDQEASKPEVGGMNEYDLLEEWTEAAGLCFDGVGDCNTTGPVRRMDILQLIRVARDLKLPSASKEASKAVPVADEREAFDGKQLFIACCLAKGRSKEDAEHDWENWEGDFMSQSQWNQAALYLHPSQPEPTSKGEPDYSEMSREQLERHAARMAQTLADDRARKFYDKHAFGPMMPPSCLCCGKLPGKVAISHAELPGVVICEDCRNAASQQRALSDEAAGEFADWLCREMPPGTVISDPAWWAPKIMRAILAASSGSKGGGE